MALLFEDTGCKQRQWQCFVCGKNFSAYEEYKSHILETHEVGREFIPCPACEAPVRDIKMHFKAKHPSRAIPVGVQMKVAVWKDFKRGKDGKKTTTTRTPHFRTGDVISQKNGGKLMHYRSGMEEEFLNLLESDIDVAAFAVEPIKIPYFFKGEWHNYIVDFKINYIDGTVELWEIKPATQTDTEVYEQNGAKWAAANNFAMNMGWEFVVQTEVGLGKLKTKVKRQRGENLME